MSNGTVEEGRSGAEDEGKVLIVRALRIAGGCEEKRESSSA